jgi:hypothetical protein
MSVGFVTFGSVASRLPVLDEASDRHGRRHSARLMAEHGSCSTK